MKPSEFLFEAEQNIKKAKANQYLDQLSDADLVAVASLLKGSLEESAQDLSAQKKAGKRIDGRPSDFIAYDDTTQTAKRYQETPQGLRVLDVNYSPPPRGYVSPGQSAPVIAPQPEVKQYVASLDNKEKEALLNVVKKEAKKRKSEPKKSEPKKSSSGKIVAGVLAGLLALGIYSGFDEKSPQEIEQQKVEQQKEIEQKKVEQQKKDKDKEIRNKSFDLEYSTKKYLKNVAKDPDSLETNFGATFYNPQKGYFVIGKYNAKNSFGGYVGWKYFITTDSPRKIYFQTDPEFEQIFNDYSSGATKLN